MKNVYLFSIWFYFESDRNRVIFSHTVFNMLDSESTGYCKRTSNKVFWSSELNYISIIHSLGKREKCLKANKRYSYNAQKSWLWIYRVFAESRPNGSSGPLTANKHLICKSWRAHKKLIESHNFKNQNECWKFSCFLIRVKMVFDVCRPMSFWYSSLDYPRIYFQNNWA